MRDVRPLRNSTALSPGIFVPGGKISTRLVIFYGSPLRAAYGERTRDIKCNVNVKAWLGGRALRSKARFRASVPSRASHAPSPRCVWFFPLPCPDNRRAEILRGKRDGRRSL